MRDFVRTRLHRTRPFLAIVLATLSACTTQAQEVGESRERTSCPFAFALSSSAALLADTSSSPSASWADIDGDGDEDLFVLNGFRSLDEEPGPQRDVLYRNDGGGAFSIVPDHPLVRSPDFAGSAVWADYDNDGDLDVFVANQSGSDNDLYRNDGGTLVAVESGPPVEDGGRSFSAAWVDVDRDGLVDLHVLNGWDGDGGEADFVYRNLGDGRFERVEGLAFQEALPSGGGVWGDYDGDGDEDLFLPVHQDGLPSRLYRNDGDWTFSEVTEAAGIGPDPLPFNPTASVAHWIDFDEDGDLDLFLGYAIGRIDMLYENLGGGRFERIVAGRLGLDATFVSDAIWADLDNDADLDLVLVGWGSASQILRNDGAGRLDPVCTGDFGASIQFGSSVSASDVDGDGDLDLYLTQWPVNERGGAPNLLYENRTPAGHWIAIELEGTRSNRSAIGATVVVTSTVGGESRRQSRRIVSRSSWRSASGLAARFGLADADAVDRIEIAWPSGAVEVVEGPISADRKVRVVEGRPVVAPGS